MKDSLKKTMQIALVILTVWAIWQTREIAHTQQRIRLQTEPLNSSQGALLSFAL